MDGYQLNRLDRQVQQHGGIILYTRENLQVQVRDDLIEKYDEALWCEITSVKDDIDLLVGVVYRSGLSKDEMNEKLIHVIQSLGECKKDIVIMGDFNYREINWELTQATTAKSEMFLDSVLDNMWTQHVTKPTRGDSLLDLVITSTPEMVDEVEVQAHLGTSDHCMLMWDLNYLVAQAEESGRRDFKKADYNKMKENLRKINWERKFMNYSADFAWAATRDIIHDEIKQHVPISQPKKKKVLWLTRRALRAVRRKQRAWKKFQSRKTTQCKMKYEKCQKECKTEIRKAKRDFERKLAEN
jgi:hypothetical protein